MAAPLLPDVLVRDQNPAVLVGLGDHRLERAAIVLLDLAAAAELLLSLLDGIGHFLHLGLGDDVE